MTIEILDHNEVNWLTYRNLLVFAVNAPGLPFICIDLMLPWPDADASARIGARSRLLAALSFRFFPAAIGQLCRLHPESARPNFAGVPASRSNDQL